MVKYETIQHNFTFLFVSVPFCTDGRYISASVRLALINYNFN